MRLSTPELQETYPLSANLAFFKAYQFLREGNPGEALAEADHLAAQAAALRNSEYRQNWLENLGNLYLECGRIKSAENWYHQLSDEGLKHADLAVIAEASASPLALVA